MHQVMASKTFDWPKKAQNESWMALKVLFSWHNIKNSFIYLLVTIISLESVRLPIICVGTIARQKSIDGYVALC